MEQHNKWLLIENKGHIDVNALILMGGSTKRDNAAAIGHFGSGNKYALALLLKHNIGFKIFSGDTEVVVTTKEVGFRDKSFKQILINGQPTSLTTDMGPLWDTWMAIREFVANSLDEGESNVVLGTDSLIGRNEYTRIFVEQCEALSDVINNWDKYEINRANGKFYMVSSYMAKAIKQSFPEIPVYGVGQDGETGINWKIVETPSKKISYLLKECLDFLKETMIDIEYPISVVTFDNMETLGLAVRSTQEILLSTKLFDMGKKEIVSTLIEEYLHLYEGVEDETRKFQNLLIRLLVSEKEERFGIFL